MPLTPGQITALRSQLDGRWTALVAELREDVDKARREQYGALAGATHDRGEESVATLLADLGQAELSRDLGELREVEAARRRIADGSYGTCTDCGGDIGLPRLQANPAAARCTPCQSRHEKTYR
jgi:RNA polymerase-binding transcription factor DksA